jgi:ActR/RegA family two-component response regulator
MNNQHLAFRSSVFKTLKISDRLIEFLSKRINLLIVDDLDMTLNCLEGFFSTPFIRVFTASNSEDAFKLISMPSLQWHCWIIDMNLGKRDNEGLDIIERHEHFPFTVIFSGIGSMEIAAQATKLGVAEVVDKAHDPINKLIIKACKIMSLGVLCKMILQKNRSLFFLLKEKIIKDPHAWAYSANMSLRQLQNICYSYTRMPPSFALPMYYGLQYLLVSSFESLSPPPEYLENQIFFTNCIDFIDQNLTHYKNCL